MAKYQFKITADDVDISSAVIAGFSIRNGRNVLTQGFIQWSANFQTFKKPLKDLLSTAGKNPDFVGPGTKVEISVYDTVNTAWITMFRGVITNTSGNKNTYSFSCIDEVFWAATNHDPVDSANFVALDGFISSFVVGLPGKSWAMLSQITATNPFPRYNPTPYSTENIAGELNKIGALAKYNMLTLYLPDDRYVNVANQYVIGQLVEPDYSVDAFSITNNDIDASYSISRNASDTYNTITANYVDGAVTQYDNTSRAFLGEKRLEVETYFNNDSFDVATTPNKAIAARDLAEAYLQQHSVYGYALISFSTSIDRVGLTIEDAVNETVPLKVIDSSAVSADEFQEKMVIQEIEHVCNPDYWQMNFVAANYRYVTPPQTWAEVSASVTWDDVPDYLTWDMMRVSEI